MSIRVLDPTVDRRSSAISMAAPVPTLEGKTVGLLDNGKFNVGRFLDHVEDILRTDHGVSEVLRERKGNASAPASDEILAHLGRCDAVISAVGD